MQRRELKIGHPARAYKAIWNKMAIMDMQENPLIMYIDKIVVPR